MTDWNQLADRSLRGEAVAPAEALAVLTSDDSELLAVLHAAFRVRRAHHGLDVRIHVLRNAKSGLCPEDCAFCSQSTRHHSAVERYPLESVEALVEGARAAAALGAVKYCMVTSTRGPSERDLDGICEAVRRIKAEFHLNVCTSLGLLKDGQAERLAAAGVTRFNHNLESSRAHFGEICHTHGYDERIATVRAAKAAGLEACCGGILGMGESLEDRVQLALELRELEVESIPVNFLDPRPGTPLGDQPRLRPQDCLRALAMFRFVNPSRDIRVAGGREVNLRHLQPLALFPANSLFSNGYLTTPGQGAEADRRMIVDLGFRVAELVAAE
ncbi:MAG: biotin synthase BioB [Gemmatimonadetes bacterium]|nr:biotin synthase BioB [Gemmatimonadota bacterium]MBK7922372.1 biotin synthase BioB [Gemmatimonadota bacterium]MBK9065392.1 biotin synthase BioB [Gemmatimonadota bacterium]MBK9690271.1 biotin synthase BioB [Gemmatimonadota bacterium]